MRNLIFSTGEYYHLYNRGVDARQIFCDERDRQFFYETLYLSMDADYKNPNGDSVHRSSYLASQEAVSVFRDCHVRVLAYNFRPNHFHLFVQQLRDDGISVFMRDFLMTYSKYFNKRTNRNASLFGEPFKAEHIDDEAYFIHIPRYIHLNSIDEQFPDWRHGMLTDWSRAKDILDADRWCSHRVYVNYPQQYPIVDESFVGEIFENITDYYAFLKAWTGRDADSKNTVPWGQY